jgi:transcriptional regulator with XRE-family HTH domain
MNSTWDSTDHDPSPTTLVLPGSGGRVVEADRVDSGLRFTSAYLGWAGPCTGVALIALLAAGSGGHGLASILIQGTGGVVIHKGDGAVATNRRHDLDASTQIRQIRAFLGLSTTQLSEVLLISRPALYAWINGVAEPRARNRDRLARIYKLATYWRNLSSEALSSYFGVGVEDRETLMTLLTAGDIDSARLIDLFERLAAGELGPASAPIANRLRSRGYALLPDSARDRQLSRYTTHVAEEE